MVRRQLTAAGALLLVLYGVSAAQAATAMRASWYNSGTTMANGHRFNPYDASTVAHKTLPFGTVLRLTNPRNGRSIRAVVRDRGPFVKGVSLDVSYGAARALGFVSRGITTLLVEIVH